MTRYTCPDKHTFETDGLAPTCPECDMVATHYNGKTGEVWTWTPREKYEDGCRTLQDAMDQAFDDQYFSDW